MVFIILFFLIFSGEMEQQVLDFEIVRVGEKCFVIVRFCEILNFLGLLICKLVVVVSIYGGGSRSFIRLFFVLVIGYGGGL